MPNGLMQQLMMRMGVMGPGGSKLPSPSPIFNPAPRSMGPPSPPMMGAPQAPPDRHFPMMDAGPAPVDPDLANKILRDVMGSRDNRFLVMPERVDPGMLSTAEHGHTEPDHSGKDIVKKKTIELPYQTFQRLTGKQWTGPGGGEEVASMLRHFGIVEPQGSAAANLALQKALIDNSKLTSQE